MVETEDEEAMAEMAEPLPFPGPPMRNINTSWIFNPLAVKGVKEEIQGMAAMEPPMDGVEGQVQTGRQANPVR